MSTRVAARRSDLAADPATRRPHLVLLGDREEVESVRPALASLRVDLEWQPGVALPNEADPTGVVLVSLAERSRPIAFLETLRTLTSSPIFVVVGSGASGRSARRLYEAGAAAVFEWPLEALLMGRFIAEMLALRFVRGKATRPDVALARTVRSHLKLLHGLPALPRVEARDGVVALSGQLDSLRQKRDVERCVAGIPGVRSLALSDLTVVPEPVPDARIRRAVARLIDASADFDPSTLALTVDGGRLLIEGSLPSRSIARLLEQRATAISGLREIENRARVSRQRHQADRVVARRLRGRLVDVFPQIEICVCFFDGTALVTGAADRLSQRREIVELVADDPAVEQVVDKLEVGS